MINIHNYEAYFLDYIEGNLPQDKIDMLINFLEKHPDLKNELNAISDIKLTPKNFAFDNSSLYRVDFENDQITQSNFEEFTIAYLENDLLSDKKSEFHQFINKDNKASEQYKLYKQTKLTPNLEITYIEKENLKKGIIFSPILLRYVSIAAVLLLAIFLNYIIFNKSQIGIKKLSYVEKFEFSKITSQPLKNEIDIEPENSFKNLNSSIKSNNCNYNKVKINTTNKYIAYSIKKEINIERIETRKKLSPVVEIVEVVNNYELGQANEEFLTPKQFISSLIKRKILKSEDKNPLITKDDFSPTIASLSNQKIKLEKSNNEQLLSIHTKNFTYEGKIKF